MDSLSADDAAIAIVVVIFVVDKVFSVLKNRGIDVHLAVKQLDDLHRWHDVRDEDGVLRWHNRRSLEDAIKTLATSMADLSRTLISIDDRLERLDSLVESVRDEIKDHG